MRLKLPPLHAGQVGIFHDPHRIVVATAGSKFGKTWCMCMWLLQQAWNRDGSVNWWVAPVFKQAQIAYRLIESLIPKHLCRPNKTEMSIELLRTDGSARSRIDFKSADNPASIRGEGVHAAVGDEAAYWVHDAYVSLWTTLSRTRGKLRLISTPKGRNAFYDEFLKGGNPDFPEFASYQLPTWLNPTVSKEAIEEFRRNMPADVFRQEVLSGQIRSLHAVTVHQA